MMKSPVAIRSLQVKPWRVAVSFVATSALLILALWGHGKINEPLSWSLRAGMSTDDVRSIMGEPTSLLGDETDSLLWYYNGDETVRLSFRQGRLCGTDQKGHPLDLEYVISTDPATRRGR